MLKLLAVKVPLDYEKYPVSEPLPDWVFWVVLTVVLVLFFIIVGDDAEVCDKCNGTGYIKNEQSKKRTI